MAAIHRAALAQLVEHRIRNAGVVGSNPIGGTTHSGFPDGNLQFGAAGADRPRFRAESTSDWEGRGGDTPMPLLVGQLPSLCCLSDRPLLW